MNEFPYIRRCINDLSNGKPRNREASVWVWQMPQPAMM
jgi:hypothetical protein